MDAVGVLLADPRECGAEAHQRVGEHLALGRVRQVELGVLRNLVQLALLAPALHKVGIPFVSVYLVCLLLDRVGL